MSDEKTGMFRKRPVIIRARRIETEMHVDTLEGRMRGNPGDWMITGVKGEQYFCKDDIFRMTYEPFCEDAKEMWVWSL